MKEIVVISGKGGTGKTSITAAFSFLGENRVVTADCDVDAADMHLLMKPDFSHEEDFHSGKAALIEQDKCSSCFSCRNVCRFDAIDVNKGKLSVNDLNCEGCGYCSIVCPSDAIRMEEQIVGKCYISKIKTNAVMVHAKLKAGAENSGKLVAKVKNEAGRIAEETGKDLVIVDGSPGIGCPVVSSLSGADFVVLVTEPTVSGLHDLKRVYSLVRKFSIRAGCIINKYDLNTAKTDEIVKYLDSENIIHLADLPYDEDFTKAMTEGKTVAEYESSSLKDEIKKIWQQLLKTIENI